MKEERIPMINKDITRLETIKKVNNKELKQKEASKRLCCISPNIKRYPYL